MKAYRVYDDEWEQIMGEGQVIEFAIYQAEYVDTDDLDYIIKDNVKELVQEVLNNGRKDISFEQAKAILNVRCFDLEEIEIY